MTATAVRTLRLTGRVLGTLLVGLALLAAGWAAPAVANEDDVYIACRQTWPATTCT